MSAAQRNLVVEAAKDWLLTPYHHNARVKGVGVDCAQLPAAVYEQVGLIDHVEPQYPHSWHLHRNEELYLQWIARVGGKPIDLDKVRPGDFMVWKFGRTYSHGAIVIDPPVIIHATAQSGIVTLGDYATEEELKTRDVLCFTLWSD